MDLLDSEMVPVPIKEMIGGVKVPVDLHVRLSDDKYVIVAKAGTYTQVEQFLSFENKKVDTLYVRKEDYRRYVGQNVHVATTVIAQTSLAPQAKSSLLSQASASVMAEVRDLGFSPEVYENAKLVAEATLQLIEQNFDLMATLTSLGAGAKGVLDHSIATSVLSVMIAKSHGWVKKNTLDKIALGALLHDIGKKELPIALQEKPRGLMTQEEVELYETHPFRGAELLRTLTVVPDDVVAILLEHHENAIGQGYPRRLKDVRLNPLSRLVAIANCFVDLTMPINKVEPKTAAEAVQHIEVTMGQPFNKEAFRALKGIVNKAPIKRSA
jgi:putative nucleotidyltransferase with HDIG domain